MALVRCNNYRKKLKDDDENSRYIPEEICLKILLLVSSAEDLGNCRSVTKMWYSIISNASFAITHFNSFPPNQHYDRFLFQTTEKMGYHFVYRHYSIDYKTIIHNNSTDLLPKKLRLPLLHSQQEDTAMPHLSDLSLEGSCDGLLLFQDKYDPQQLYISNPLTNFFKSLPTDGASQRRVHWTLVRDTSLNQYMVFGILNASALQMLTLEGMQGEGTGWSPSSWSYYRYQPCRLPRLKHRVLSQIILLQNRLHWVALDKDRDGQYCYYIYHLAISTIGFMKTIVPTQFVKPSETLEFTTSKALHLLKEVEGGDMCLIIVYRDRLCMFILEDRLRDIWTKSHIIDLHSLSNLPSLVNGFFSRNTCLVPLRGVAQSTNNLAEVIRIIVHHGNFLWLYDLNTQLLKPIGYLGVEQQLFRRFIFHSDSLLRWDSAV